MQFTLLESGDTQKIHTTEKTNKQKKPQNSFRAFLQDYFWQLKLFIVISVCVKLISIS